MSQTDFDVEAMDAVTANGIEAVDRSVMISPELLLKTPKKLNMVRSEASHKAWETRRRNKEAAKVVPVTAGITGEQANLLEQYIQREFEAREEYAAAETRLVNARTFLQDFIQSITAKEK